LQQNSYDSSTSASSNVNSQSIIQENNTSGKNSSESFISSIPEFSLASL
jgi:hypothetical protein